MQDAANSARATAGGGSSSDSDIDSDSAVTKARIIRHMNADHAASLARYLEFYCRLPRARAERNARLEDITFEYLIVTCGGSSSSGSNNNNDKHKNSAAPTPPPTPAPAPARHVIPLDPPLARWSDARARLVHMDAAALAGLARSATAVRRYRAPRSALHVAVFAACVLTFAAFWRRANFRPGALLHDYLLVPGSRRPQQQQQQPPQAHPSSQQLLPQRQQQQGQQQRWQQTATKTTQDPTAAAAAEAGAQGFGARFAHFCYTIQPALITAMLAIHVAEAAWMHATRLRRYNVPLLSRVWWAWMLSTFVEGVGAFQRLDALVREEEEEAERKKRTHGEKEGQKDTRGEKEGQK
jgi:hypothetical protein